MRAAMIPKAVLAGISVPVGSTVPGRPKVSSQTKSSESSYCEQSYYGAVWRYSRTVLCDRGVVEVRCFLQATSISIFMEATVVEGLRKDGLEKVGLKHCSPQPPNY